MRNICVFGNFALGTTTFNGQTVKTRIITDELARRLGKESIHIVDTYHKGAGKLLISFFAAMKKSGNTIIFPAQKAIRFAAPLAVLGKLLFRTSIHYVVIGGWLPEYLDDKRLLKKALKYFDGIYVETAAMKNKLGDRGFSDRVIVMPNCKKIESLKPSDFPQYDAPYQVCTFSRVMKEKGIEAAIEAVTQANAHFGKRMFELVIYGGVDSLQTEWFDRVKAEFKDHIRYGGVVPYENSLEILCKYYALLFPTYYDGEGFAGTLIDAMAAGVPVIASDWRYNAEIVDHGKTGLLFPAKDTQALTQRLIWIAEHTDAWYAMKKDCLRAAKQFDVAAVTERLINRLK